MDERDESWAAVEFAGAALGDPRRTARLVRLAERIGAQPQAPLAQAVGADGGGLKAAYRFFANARVDEEAVVASHVAATLGRCAGVPVVLAVQDTTLLDFTAHPATTGVGRLGNRHQRGLVAHTTLAVTPERLPLGLLAQERLVRADGGAGTAGRKAQPIAQKESRKWLHSLAAVGAAAAACPGTLFVSVGDREADVYDLFVQARPARVELLVRAAQDRRVEDAAGALWATAERAAVAATITVHVPARGAQPARVAQPARDATVRVRHCPVVLRPPKHRAAEHLPPAAVWAVLAREEDPPAGAEPLEWLLLTTRPVASGDDAVERTTWYACRWGIEVLHKVLKSGCRIEAKQLATADRLERCLALYTVVAWRVLYATMLARALPDAPCSVLLEDDEWRALYCITHATTVPPAAPPPLRQAVHWIGRLGGFPGRARDGDPGPTTLWRGLQRLHDLTAMYRLMTSPPPPPTCG